MKKSKQIPKLQELKHTQLEACTFMILKQPQSNHQINQDTETNTTTKEQQKIHQCITCKKKFYENKNLATHRANKPACKLIWKIEYDTQRTCQNQNCGEKFPTVEKCKKHTLYHCHEKNANTPLNQTTTGKKDRRTIQGRGTPQENEQIYQGRITYDTAINKWICNTCGKNMTRKTNKTQYNMHVSTSQQQKK